MIRSLDVVVRHPRNSDNPVLGELAAGLLSMIFVPGHRPALLLRDARAPRKWLHVQEVMGESVTVLQENLAGMHVVKAFASEDYERAKYNRKPRSCLVLRCGADARHHQPAPNPEG